MADEIVLYVVDDKVCIITLNRPEKLNAISRELQLALTEAFARADADPATSVVLLRAEGRSFCAGYDIGAQPEGTDDWRSNPTKAHAHLEPQLEFGMVGMRHQPGFGRRHDALLLSRRHRIGRFVQRGAGLDLDKRDQVAPPGDDIDFAIRRAEALRQDAITLQHQIGRGAGFR